MVLSSYEVIARRWRPQDFSGLVGQDHIRTTLLNALQANRLHHALLFTGPRGTGKTSTARILAKALRCPNATNFVACQKCSECEEIASGNSLSVIEIDGASNNGVDAIRELRETVGFLPASGRYKLYIIDEVHMLSTSAFNALLKTLEEPPAHVYFVLATTEVQKIPNTILSRCQRFDFRRIATRAIAQHLQFICERDGVSFEPEALWTIARQGDGSMRDAQSLMDQVINFTNADLKRDLVVSTLGLTDRGLLMEILAAILKGDTGATLTAFAQLHKSGGDPKLLLLDLLEQLRHALVLKLGQNHSLVDLPDSEKEALVEMARTLTNEDLHLLFDMTLKGLQDLQRASDTLLILEMILLRMASAPRLASGWVQTTAAGAAPARPQAQSQQPRTATVAVASSKFAATVTPTAPAASHTPIASTHPPDLRFQKLVDKIKEVNGLIGAQLENCYVVELTHNQLTLGVSNKHKFLFDKISQPEFKKKVLNYVTSFWGPGYSLQLVLKDAPEDALNSPKTLQQKQEKADERALRQAVEAHPLVQSVQAVFKTEIKAIKEMKT